MAGIGYNNRLDEGFPTMGSLERQRAWARDRASRGRYSPERSPGDVLPAIGFGIYDALKERGAFTPSAGPAVPFGGSQAARNVVAAEQQARQQKQANPDARQGAISSSAGQKRGVVNDYPEENYSIGYQQGRMLPISTASKLLGGKRFDGVAGMLQEREEEIEKDLDSGRYGRAYANAMRNMRDVGIALNPIYHVYNAARNNIDSGTVVYRDTMQSDIPYPVAQRPIQVSPMRAHSSGPGTPFDGNQAGRNVAAAEQQATQQNEPARRRQPDQGTYRGGLLGVYRDRWDDVKRHYNDGGLLGGIGAGIRNWNGAAVDTILAPYSAGLDALTSEPAKAFYRGITGKERPAPAASPTSPQRQAGTTGQSPQVQQSKAAGAVPSQPSQAAANAAEQAGASGAKEQRQHPGEARYGTYAAGPTWFDVEGSNGQVRVGYWDVDGRRQTLVRHGTFPEKSQAQPQQPRGLHYVPGGWANDGYSFEGSAEDRARFFAPVSRPYNHAPRSDNDTFLALQRQRAMQPVEQPLPERPEFPPDRRMGWHTKLAKYQADMDAYNRQMANIAGYRQAMDVAALQQMPKPADPVEQARLERALALQERQAAQQAAYQQAQLDQRDREMVQNYLNSMPERQVQAARLGYQAMTNQAASDLLDAYRSGDQARIARAGAVWNALNNTSEKKGNEDKWEIHKVTDENGNERMVRVRGNGNAENVSINSLDAQVTEAKQALLKDIGRYDQNNPEVKKLVAAVKSAETLEEVRAVQEGMKSIGK